MNTPIEEKTLTSHKINKVDIRYGGKSTENYHSREYSLAIEIELVEGEKVKPVIEKYTKYLKDIVEKEMNLFITS